MEHIPNKETMKLNCICDNSFFDYLKKEYLSEKSISVLQMRLSGKSVEEIARFYNNTFERIRQIEVKAMAKITKKGHSLFAEDKYAYFFKTYGFDKEWFTNHFNESEKVWYYLNMRYQQGNEKLPTI